MISVSNSWKQAMSQRLRERIYISVGIGVINQNAQGSGSVNAELAYWSKGNVFDKQIITFLMPHWKKITLKLMVPCILCLKIAKLCKYYLMDW